MKFKTYNTFINETENASNKEKYYVDRDDYSFEKVPFGVEDFFNIHYVNFNDVVQSMSNNEIHKSDGRVNPFLYEYLKAFYYDDKLRQSPRFSAGMMFPHSDFVAFDIPFYCVMRKKFTVHSTGYNAKEMFLLGKKTADKILFDNQAEISLRNLGF